MPRVRTEKETLDKLSQFEPAGDFGFIRYDSSTDAYSPFPIEREREIRQILVSFIRPYIRKSVWSGKLTGIERFTENSLVAIALYESQRNQQSHFDRSRAQMLLEETSTTLQQAIEKLERILQWRELDNFLSDVFHQVARLSKSDKREKENSTLNWTLKRAIAEINSNAAEFRTFSPFEISIRLRRLQNIISITADNVTFGFGDARRDKTSRSFTDELAFAWATGVGKIPTYSRPNRQSREPSPFAALLKLINEKVLSPEHRSHNNFREHAVKSVKDMKRLAKEGKFT